MALGELRNLTEGLKHNITNGIKRTITTVRDNVNEIGFKENPPKEICPKML